MNLCEVLTLLSQTIGTFHDKPKTQVLAVSVSVSLLIYNCNPWRQILRRDVIIFIFFWVKTTLWESVSPSCIYACWSKCVLGPSEARDPNRPRGSLWNSLHPQLRMLLCSNERLQLRIRKACHKALGCTWSWSEMLKWSKCSFLPDSKSYPALPSMLGFRNICVCMFMLPWVLVNSQSPGEFLKFTELHSTKQCGLYCRDQESGKWHLERFQRGQDILEPHRRLLTTVSPSRMGRTQPVPETQNWETFEKTILIVSNTGSEAESLKILDISQQFLA